MLPVNVRYHFGVTALVPSENRDHDDPEGLRSRVAEHEAILAGRDAEMARVRADLDAFKINYRQRVGRLHEQLDAIELAMAEAELGERRKSSSHIESGTAAPNESSRSARPEPPPRYTSDAVRRLFRDVAKAIHPDLARDEFTKDRRHSLMVEANRAYASRDEDQLRSILQAWERSPEAVPGSDSESVRLRLVRRIAQIEEELEILESDLTILKDSPLWKLKAMVDEAAAMGKDLVREMVVRLKRDIMAATNRLDAMRPPP